MTPPSKFWPTPPPPSSPISPIMSQVEEGEEGEEGEDLFMSKKRKRENDHNGDGLKVALETPSTKKPCT